MNTQTMALDVSKQPSVAPVLYLGQNDKSGTTLAASVYDNGAELPLSGHSVRFCMKLPDGEHYYSVNGSASGNVATFAIDESYAAAVAGVTDTAYVEVLTGNSVIASTNRIHVVVLDGAREGASMGETHASEIDAATAAATSAANSANSAAASAQSAAQSANAAAAATANVVAQAIEAIAGGSDTEAAQIQQLARQVADIGQRYVVVGEAIFAPTALATANGETLILAHATASGETVILNS